jgi:[ribosomal protein S5]-alanine N-acetyltransferase
VYLFIKGISFAMQNSLNTEKLNLTLLSPEDHVFVRELVNSKGWLEFIGNRDVHSQAEALAYIDRIVNTPDLFYWVVRLKTEGTPIGIISFLKRSYLEHFDLGFAFLPEYGGQGYAFSAAVAIQSMAQQMLEHQTILATTIPSNVQSIKLLTRLGFAFDREISVDGETLLVYRNTHS